MAFAPRIPEMDDHNMQGLRSAADAANLLDNQDLVQVQEAVYKFQLRERIGHLPLYVLGIGDGGRFATLLPHVMSVKGMTIFLSGLAAEGVLNPVPEGKTFPPTMFAYMPKDKATSQAVQHSVAMLRQKGIPTGELRLNERPVTPYYLCNRTGSDYISPGLSINITAALVYAKIVSPSYKMQNDPRKIDWKPILRRVFSSSQNRTILMEGDRSMLEQELNLAWAEREFVSDYTTWCLQWMEGARIAPSFDVDLLSVTCDGEVYEPILKYLKAEDDNKLNEMVMRMVDPNADPAKTMWQEDFEKRGMTKKHLYKRCDTGTTGCVKHNLELAEQTKRKMHNTENRHAAKKKKQDSAQAAAVAAKHRKGKYVAQKQRIDSLAKKAKEEDENMENATEELLKKNMHSSTRVRGDTGRK